MLTVFVDGVPQIIPPERGINWTLAATLHVLTCNQVVGIECMGFGGGFDGILLSTDSGIVSDSSWRCSLRDEVGWSQAGFVETQGVWQDATSFGKNGLAPWGNVSDIAEYAHWIWLIGDNSTPKTVYCRKYLKI